MLDESEKRGNGGITPLGCLMKGRTIKIHINNLAVDTVMNTNIPSLFEIFVHGKITIW